MDLEEQKESAAIGQGRIHCLSIIGQIEGHQLLPDDVKSTKYEHVLPMIAAVEEATEIDALLILLNTMGGDVEAGLAIAEMIAGMKKPTVSLVLGGGHSIGVPLAVAAERSMIAPSAAMTIHPVRTTSAGCRHGSQNLSQPIPISAGRTMTGFSTTRRRWQTT